MTQDKTDKAPCPDAQTLAAFVDNTLPMEKRGEVKTHLADCGRCLAIVAETLKTGEDLSQAASPSCPAVHKAGGSNGIGRRLRSFWYIRISRKQNNRRALQQFPHRNRPAGLLKKQNRRHHKPLNDH